ncbi:MAG: hypothetical protein VKK42_23775 [Lyngbya sp.]|nr:hypothetical protein [Lyngbya sp.]
MAEENNPYERVRLTVFMPLWVRNALKQYVVTEDVSMSQWMAGQAEKAVIAAGFKPPRRLKYNSLSELVTDNRDSLLNNSRLTPEELDKIIKQNCCHDIDLLRIALVLDISEEEIRDLAQRSHPNYDNDKQECCNG